MSDQQKAYLEKFNSICWYPSAGKDFREMMYLSAQYAKLRGWNEDIFPDCFVLTDICGFMYEGMLSNILIGHTVVFDDLRGTKIEAFNGHELDNLNIPFKRRVFSDSDENYGRVICADIKITSSVLGEINTKLVYVIMENTSFAIDYLLKEGIKIDYLVQVRYGMGVSTGMYVKYLLKDFGTRYFISDWNFPANEDYAYNEYIDLLKDKTETTLLDTSIQVQSYQWSNSGDVRWYKVK